MKCPKCGYLGFETSDRCRNCGYDFSLSVSSGSPPELPLRGDGGAAPLADFNLGPAAPDSPSSSRPTPSLDLDRLIGAGADAEQTVVRAPTPRPVRVVERPRPEVVAHAADAPPDPTPPPAPAEAPAATLTPEELPLFTKPGADA